VLLHDRGPILEGRASLTASRVEHPPAHSPNGTVAGSFRGESGNRGLILESEGRTTLRHRLRGGEGTRGGFRGGLRNRRQWGRPL